MFYMLLYIAFACSGIAVWQEEKRIEELQKLLPPIQFHILKQALCAYVPDS